MSYDERRERARTALRPKLTEDFLNTVKEAAEVVGWEADLVEVAAFVEELFEIAGKGVPCIKPVDYDD